MNHYISFKEKHFGKIMCKYGLISTSPHNIITINNNGNFRKKRILKRSIPTLRLFEVFPFLCHAAQGVIISKSNTLPEFVGSQYL